METAAVLLIGDELLAGSTQDKNLHFAAQLFLAKGVKVREARVVADEEEAIVTALNALRARYTYVVTSGGIGPTHDDITVESVAKALGLPLEVDEQICQKFRDKHGPSMKPEVLLMARHPKGAKQYENGLTTAPGFRIENVLVCAGIPSHFQAMLQAAAVDIAQGRPIETFTLKLLTRESIISKPLKDLQAVLPDVPLGSYPSYLEDGTTVVKLVARSADPQKLAQAAQKLRDLAQQLNLTEWQG